MAIAPIALGGARLSVMSTADMDEFGCKIENLMSSAKRITMNNGYFNIGILLSVIFILGICILIFGYWLTRNIQYLAAVAERISGGDLNVKINYHSNDEIGKLAVALSCIQGRLRFAIERLRRK